MQWLGYQAEAPAQLPALPCDASGFARSPRARHLRDADLQTEIPASAPAQALRPNLQIGYCKFLCPWSRSGFVPGANRRKCTGWTLQWPPDGTLMDPSPILRQSAHIGGW